MIVLIDNYDSFTYNLVQRIGELGKGHEVRVFRNDAATPQQVAQELHPTHLIISPGPCTPDQAGESMNFIRFFHGKIPVLGVCLGHQCIGEAYGGRVVRAAQVMHGKLSQVEHDGLGVFAGLPNPLTATRYHSLVVEPESLPAALTATAWTQAASGGRVLMGIRHREHPVEGVQFHPESILTDNGHDLLRNFIDLCLQRAAVLA